MIIQQLNQRLPARRSATAVTRTARPSTPDAESTFSHDELFPIIADIIHQTYRRSPAFVTHDEIVSGLLAHPQGRDLVTTARQRQGDEKPLTVVAANMVAWFSQRITVHTSDYQDMFQRQQIDGKWAYRPAQDRSAPS